MIRLEPEAEVALHPVAASGARTSTGMSITRWHAEHCRWAWMAGGGRRRTREVVDRGRAADVGMADQTEFAEGGQSAIDAGPMDAGAWSRPG